MVEAYRSCWMDQPSPVLTGVSMGLRSMTKQVAGVRVSQRLKRVDRIVGKLMRFPTMSLARMDDIGGCRVVVAGLEELRALETRIRDRWSALLVGGGKDYVAHPKGDTGYRAVHIIVRRRGLLVEIQLRTARQQRWATLVEQLELQTGQPLKDGVGHPDTVVLLARLSEFMAYSDRNERPPDDLRQYIMGWARSVPS
jgi:putative GTP pyrophosphokinase